MGILTRALKGLGGPLDDRWYTNWFNLGTATATGVKVDQISALQATAVFDCVRILAEDTASLPLHVYEWLERGRRRAREHPMENVLNQASNPEMDAMFLRQTLQGHLGLWGNAYANIVRDNGGRVRELWPLRPDRMRVVRNKETRRLVYQYRVGAEVIPLDPDDVLHIRGFGLDGVVGLSPIELHRETVGLALATQEMGARFFGNDARPGVVMEVPGRLTPDAKTRLQQDTEDKYRGLSNKHRIMVLEEGVKLHEVGVPPETAQYLQTRKFQVEEIARMYRMPLHKINSLDRATNNNIEHQSLEYVQDTLSPWFVRWEKAIALSLMSPDERKRYYVEHLVEGRLRGDYKSRMQGYALGRQWGWFSVNDIRAMENQNPIEGGDEYLVPLNMQAAGQSADDLENAQKMAWRSITAMPVD